ncbi:MAG: hypothetical protein JWM71_1932, partial [Solirubrobacteraceae bacterium]|nr:hypothetical protein [Solirubrobacteraceae bacterium]
IQGQDPRGARLAVRARTRGLTAADVDRALTEDRSLVITWVNRGTLHLIASEDYAWLHALTTPPLITANLRRLEQEGVSPAAARKGVRVVERALAADGPLTRDELRGRLDAAKVPTKRQALVHILMRATLLGLILRGPMRSGHHAFVLVADWLPAVPDVDRDVALAELARRYLAGHGPAGDCDLAKWAGLPLRDARAGLTAIASELTERPDGLVDLRRRPAEADGVPPPRLLGPFDPLLHGWVDRSPVTGENGGIVTSNGLFRPIALVKGRAAGTWGLPRGHVELEPFAPLSATVRRALAAEAADVQRFLGTAA